MIHINTTIGKKIKSIRQSHSISQIALAKKAGIAQSTLSYIENGRKTPQFETLAAICKALDMTILELLTYNEPDVDFKLFEQNPAWGHILSQDQSGICQSISAEKGLPADSKNEISALERYLFSEYTQQERRLTP